MTGSKIKELYIKMSSKESTGPASKAPTSSTKTNSSTADKPIKLEAVKNDEEAAATDSKSVKPEYEQAEKADMAERGASADEVRPESAEVKPEAIKEPSVTDT